MAKSDTSSWLSKSNFPLELQLHVPGFTFPLSKELLALRSAKVAAMLKQNPHENLANFLLKDIHANPESIELLARFCHGFEPNLSTDKIIPLTCLVWYLEMTESHSSDNLLKKALAFFEQRVLSNWNETIKALRSVGVGASLQHAVELGLVDACIESLIEKVQDHPRLLGEPITNSTSTSTSGEHSEDEDGTYRPNARRRLFVLDWESEDLTTLSPQLYELIIQAMNQRGVSPKYVAASVCQYAQKWIFSNGRTGEEKSIDRRNSQRDAVEAVEKLLPRKKGLIPCTLLFKLLRSSIILDASNGCRNGFEIRIGMQLDQATVQDLLIPSQGYAKEVQYDINSVRRMLKHFYANCTSSESSDISGLISVAELIEDFLAEIANDIDLKTDTFVSLAEMSMAASLGTQRNSDGIYRAVDIYLDKHKHLTETEREELCRVLDCHKMSPEACEHAAKNKRLPLRFVVQVLFVAHLQLTKKVQLVDDKLRREEVEEDHEVGHDEEDQVRTEMEKMSIKVVELEKECHIMRKEIEHGCSHHRTKKDKVNMWKEMKRKFGCTSSIHDCNCQVKKKKVHPK